MLVSNLLDTSLRRVAARRLGDSAESQFIAVRIGTSRRLSSPVESPDAGLRGVRTLSSVAHDATRKVSRRCTGDGLTPTPQFGENCR